MFRLNNKWVIVYMQNFKGITSEQYLQKICSMQVYPDCGGLQADMMGYSCFEKNDIFVQGQIFLSEK